MSKSFKKDLTGQRFGRLTVLEFVPTEGKKSYWNCKCDCGNYKVVLLGNLTTGKIKSCGCLNKEKGLKLKKTNPYIIKNNVVELYTFNTNNKFIIDIDDYEKIKDYCWFENSNGYIMNRTNHKNIMLHRLITNCPNDKVVDHLDHNPLNNCKINLRICTQKENMQNIYLKNNNSLECSGITKIMRNSNEYYIVQINGYRGCFKYFDDAKKLRDKI